MRLFAEEKRSGSIETLMTLPVTESSVAAGKWLAAFLSAAVMVAPTMLYIIPLFIFDRIDEILDLILETVCSKRKKIIIAGDEYPAELVKAKFMKLDSSHIEFVLDCMQENTTKVRNIKQYLKAVLFNAPSTIGNYYTALVNHDMYGRDDF